MTTSRPALRICFVCSGNICRSPMAEAVMRARLRAAGLDGRVEVDSAGTGDWHVGQQADRRALRTLATHGYDGARHRARVFEPAWFATRDLVVALDGGHARELRSMAPTEADRAKVRLLRSFDPAAPDAAEAALDVADPYYGADDDFVTVLTQVEAACDGLLAEVRDLLAEQARPGA